MNNEQLQRTLRLLKRTGDKGFIMDPDGIFVLMGVDDYENILDTIDNTPPSGPEVNFTEDVQPANDKDDEEGDVILDDLLKTEEKAVEPEIAVTPEITPEPSYFPVQQTESVKLEMAKESDPKPALKPESISPGVPRKPNEGLKKLHISSDWIEKKKNTIINEESLEDVPHDEDEEEKFYLEPVE